MAGSTSSAVQPATEAQKMAGCCEARALVDALEGVLADELDAALEQVGELTRDVVAHVGGL